MHGFQIWINVPSAMKMEDPAYGTHSESQIPVYSPTEGVNVRVLAGEFQNDNFNDRGPFETKVNVQILDVFLAPGKELRHEIPEKLDSVLVYCYDKTIAKGSTVNGWPVQASSVVRLDAEGGSSSRGLHLSAGPGDSLGLQCLVFSGKKLRQPIAWHGPFLMTTDNEIDKAIQEYRAGTFLKKKVPWDYKQMSKAPPGMYDSMTYDL